MKKTVSFLLVCIMMLVLNHSNPEIFGQEKTDSMNFAAATTVLYTASAAISTPASVKAARINSSSLKITWKKVSGASGYSVYKWNGQVKKYKPARTLTGNGKTAWTDTKLKSNITYKYKIRAYRNVSGKKLYGPFSETVSARAFTNTAKTVNAKSIRVDYTTRYLGLAGTKKIAGTVMVPGGKTSLSKNLTWKSSNRSIVKVNQYGWIEARGKAGKAKVIIRAHNGVTKTLAITVADYARPAKFIDLAKVKKWNKTASAILDKYRPEMIHVAAFLERYKKRTHYMYEDGDLHIEFDYINCDPVRDDLTRLLKNTNMLVMLERGEVIFSLPVTASNIFGASIVYTDENGKDVEKEGKIKIAPCWYFIDGRNDLD